MKPRDVTDGIMPEVPRHSKDTFPVGTRVFLLLPGLAQGSCLSTCSFPVLAAAGKDSRVGPEVAASPALCLEISQGAHPLPGSLRRGGVRGGEEGTL